MRILIIVQARLNSTRLPKKVLRPILGRPLLYYLFQRLSFLKTSAQIVLATTENKVDDPIAEFCAKNHILCFRGEEENVLQRFYKAALAYPCEVLVRITGDCPLVDPALLDAMLSFYLKNFPKYEYLSNVLNRRYPKGLDLEIFSFKALKKAYLEARTTYQKEHVTPYFYQNKDLFSLYSYEDEEDFSSFNLSVDLLEDFQRVEAILEKYFPHHPNFGVHEIKSYLSNAFLEVQ